MAPLGASGGTILGRHPSDHSGQKPAPSNIGACQETCRGTGGALRSAKGANEMTEPYSSLPAQTEAGQ